MKVTAIIPARYNSSRFRGKPLADLWGKPMIWWVYQQVNKVKRIDEVWVATDHEAIQSVCREYGMNCRMTSAEHGTSTERVYEMSRYLPSDIYLCINGDEPLISPEIIARVIPEGTENFYAANLMTRMLRPAEVVDTTNIKVVTDVSGSALFMSRSPIPCPKSSLQFEYYKHLGVLAYSAEALRFFSETEKGPNERVEDINELRFIEHGKKLKMIPVSAESLSVDTPKDLDYVRHLIGRKIERGEIKL